MIGLYAIKKKNGANIISLVFEKSSFEIDFIWIILQLFKIHDNIKNKILNNFCRIFSCAVIQFNVINYLCNLLTNIIFLQ